MGDAGNRIKKAGCGRATPRVISDAQFSIVPAELFSSSSYAKRAYLGWLSGVFSGRIKGWLLAAERLPLRSVQHEQHTRVGVLAILDLRVTQGPQNADGSPDAWIGVAPSEGWRRTAAWSWRR